MNIALPVYLYDVVTTDDPPRLIVTCRTEPAALDLAQRLTAAPRDGSDVFTVAPRRVGSVDMTVDPGSSVVVRGYEVASEVLAAAIASIPAPVVEPPVEAVPDVAVEEPAP